MKKKRLFDWMGIIVPCVVVLSWYLITKFDVVPSYKFSSPKMVLKAMLDFAFGLDNGSMYSGAMWKHLGMSFYRVMKGFVVATLLAVPLGFCVGRISVLRRMVDPLIQAFKAVPGMGWLPIAIVWFGIGESGTMFLVTLGSFFPIYVNTMDGAMRVDPMLIKAGKVLGASKLRILATITFPAAFPNILVGLRFGLGSAWAYLVVGEITGVNEGLGAIMTEARMLGRLDMIIVSMIIIAVAAKLSDHVLMKISSLFYPAVCKGGVE